MMKWTFAAVVVSLGALVACSSGGSSGGSSGDAASDGPPTFNPGKIAGLVVWLDADDTSTFTLAAIPTTHSLGDLARALAGRALPGLVHVYFHDTDLLDRRRRALIALVLPVLARRSRVTDLDALAARLLPGAPRVPWDDVARL